MWGLRQSLYLMLTLIAVLQQPVYAEQDQQYERKAATAVISADVYDQLIKAQEMQEAGDASGALLVLDALKARTGRKALKPYELAQMWNFYAYAYLAKEDFAAAIRAFTELLKQPDIPQALVSSTEYTLAQLYFAEGDVVKATTMLEQWFSKAENPSPDAYVLLAQMYLQREKTDAALQQLLKAFDAAKAQGREEKENWYALLQYVYAEKQQYKQQLKALEVLVNRWPKRNYWLALMGTYAELGLDKRQLAAMDAAYQQGMLDQETYLVSYAQMLVANQQPYQAAKVMQQRLDKQQIKRDAKNLERTGEYFRRAQETEKALPYLKEAARLAEDGEPAVRLAYVYMNRYLYKDAVASIELAFNKGDIEKPLDAKFLLAQAQFHAGQYEQARGTLQAVVKLARQQENERISKQAGQWLRFIDSEIKRQQDIDAYLKG